MSIGRTKFEDISEADLNGLIQAAVPEGLTIDYKRDAYGNSDANKKEALKDITSFANSAGGHLIIGMEETNGLPTRLSGLPGVDLDGLVNRLESLIRDGVEPRIVGVRMRRVNLIGGGEALVIRVPRSWNPPHRVSTAKTNRFYVRNSGGVHEASVEELRVLFNLAADAQERIKRFRSDRLKLLDSGEGVVGLSGGARLVVHLVPLSAFGQTTQIDPERVYKVHQQFRPIAAEAGMTPRFSLEGFVNTSGHEDCHAYTLVFRNGIVEATNAGILDKVKEWNILHAGWTTRSIVEVIPTYFEGLRALDVPTPIVLMVSYQRVKGAKLGIMGYDHRLGEIASFRSNELLLPDVIIDDYGSSSDYISALRSVFDALWNAAGFARCTYFETSGEWKPPH